MPGKIEEVQKLAEVNTCLISIQVFLKLKNIS